MLISSEASVPKPRKIPCKLQALVGEEGSETATFSSAVEFYKVNVYFSSLDFVTNELESRFSGNDQDVLCAFSEVAMKDVPSPNSFDIVAEHCDIDKDLLMVEHDLFDSFQKADSNIQLNNPSDILSCIYENDLVNFLSSFF